MNEYVGNLRLTVDRANGLDDAGWPWFDIDGLIGDLDGSAVRYSGRAVLQGKRFVGHAYIDGVLRAIELTITIEAHGCGRDDCGLRRNPDRGGELYYARLVCGHGNWPCTNGCRRPVHPVERCPDAGAVREEPQVAELRRQTTNEDPMVTIRRLRQRLYIVEPVYRAAVALHRNGARKTFEATEHVERVVDRALAIERKIAEGWLISDGDLMKEAP